MEIGLTLLGLGAAYVISNQSPSSSNKSSGHSHNNKNKYTRENFANLKQQNTNYLPNTDIPIQNYPVTNVNALSNNINGYNNPNQATDKYFDQNNYENNQNAGVKVGNNIQQVYSLTGQYVDTSNFEHNNMVPFYGGKIKGQVYNVDTAETILDNMIGSGSQVIKKIEQAPLFKPQDNMQFANGAPNMSDFYQSRVNPAMKNSNVKPFESIYVGPGLNQGFTAEGSLGYNSGMEARDSWLPKTVDELRVSTNPKLEYTLEDHQGPSYSTVKNLGQIGKVEKYHPDTFFIQTQDRWLTTTGQEKGETLRPVQEDRPTARAAQTRSYTGVAAPSEKNAGYAESHYEQPRRPVLQANDIGPSAAQNRGSHLDKDNAQRSHTNYTNNRAMARQPDTLRSGFSGAIGAVSAPIMDIFKPVRREEYVSNIRIYGDAVSQTKQNYVMSPGDVPITTVKETTVYSPNFYIGNQIEGGGYMTAEQQAISNQRDTTLCGDIGNPGGNSAGWGNMNYDSAYMQTNNESKEKAVVGRTNHGNTQVFNQQMNVNIARIDSDRNNTRTFVPTNMPQMPIGKEQYGKIHAPQYYNECVGCDRISPDILSAFKSNPYTHSLTDCV